MSNQIASMVLGLGLLLTACESSTGSGGEGGSGGDGGAGADGGAGGDGGAGADGGGGADACEEACWESNPECFVVDVPDGSFQCNDATCSLDEVCYVTIDDFDCTRNKFSCKPIVDEEDPCSTFEDSCFACDQGEDGGYVAECYD